MILRCLARRPLAIPSLAAAARTPALARTIYTVPALANHVELQQNGVPGLLTSKGFQTAYTDYQQHMIDELNESTAGTPNRAAQGHQPPASRLLTPAHAC